MSAEQIAFQVAFASVDSGDGGDCGERAERILRRERVLAAIRGFDGEATTVLLPITEQGNVVALDAEGRLRFDLSAVGLQTLFADAGLTLHLGYADHALDEVDAELEQEFGEVFEQLDEAPDDLIGLAVSERDDGTLFAPDPVHVAEFSRRGPWAARVTAQLLATPVDYLEDAGWSVYRYRTDRAHGAISGSSADRPIIEVNVPVQGDAWIEVDGSRGRTAMFWPNAERLTRPVLEIDQIGVSESAELYRRMLSEADGTRDELAELDLGDAIDADAVLRACLPEALGGIVGEPERLRAFVAAFGVPAALVDAGLNDAGLEDGGAARRFAPRGWMPVIGDVVMAGITETVPLTRRDRPVARWSRLLRKRPLLGAALSVGELSVGVALGRGRSRLGRGVGILLVIDALADLAILAIRLLRR
ncbi:hypothetical protein ACFPJ2_09145 [Microbacterium suwonense]|uniref:hypothetical protein n=1 Tax=Microbacterium suwonense TaxID=683047 RepID=UPI00361DBAE4